jgi:Glycosyltransferase family 87
MARSRTAHLALLLLTVAATMTIGAALKAPCANARWVEHRQGPTTQCYSDVADLLHTEQLAGGRLPYLDPCAAAPKPCDEYPVISMYVMRATASLTGERYAPFFWLNALLLLGCALVIAWLVDRMGGNAWMFAAAPTLVVYGTMNWDLIAVALATAGTFAFVRHRDGWAGVLLGVGAAAKFYPALLVIPFAAQRLHDRDGRGAATVASGAAGAWLVLNVPFALGAPAGWWEFFRYNGARPAEYDSLWFVACRHGACAGPGLVNLLSIALTAGGLWLVWREKARRDPGFARWTLAFPLLILFLLTNKVDSPQYGLWLLPWFALVSVDLRAFLAFQATEVAVFITRFSYFGTLDGRAGLSYGAMEVALLARAAVLLWCLVAWTRGRETVPAGAVVARSYDAAG